MKINSFNPVADAYSQSVVPYRSPQYVTLIHELNLKGDEVVLDIGSGPGELSMQIAGQLNNGGHLFGIDLSPEMVQLAQKTARTYGNKNVSFNKGNALNLEFEDNSFDVIVSSNAFPWVSDRTKFLNEVYRVLKPSGRFGLVALSNICYKEFASAFKKVAEDHKNYYPKGKPFELMGAKLHSLSELSQLVSKKGFKVKRQFQFSTEEPINADDYINRVNAIVNENYLDYIQHKSKRDDVKRLLKQSMESKNGSLKITESSIFIIAIK